MNLKLSLQENREEKVARCKIGGCKKPEVKLFIKGSRVGAGNPTSHLKKYHQDVWSQYTEKKKSDDSQKEAEKKKSEEASEMEDSQRINTRTRAGQLPFLSKVASIMILSLHFKMSTTTSYNL